MQSKAKTVAQYLAELPADRRAAIQAVRAVILKNLDKNYQETMQYGMIGYSVPHSLYPAGYHCDPKQPLPFAGLASQKHHLSLYILTIYNSGSEENWLRDQFAKAGKKLDMGKCCIRFKRVEDLPLDVIGEMIRRVPVKRHIEFYEANIRVMNKRASKRPVAKKAGPTAKAGRKTPAKKSPAKTLASKARKARR